MRTVDVRADRVLEAPADARTGRAGIFSQENGGGLCANTPVGGRQRGGAVMRWGVVACCFRRGLGSSPVRERSRRLAPQCDDFE
jgi:hypothetical protein